MNLVVLIKPEVLLDFGSSTTPRLWTRRWPILPNKHVFGVSLFLIFFAREYLLQAWAKNVSTTYSVWFEMCGTRVEVRARWRNNLMLRELWRTL